MPLIKNVLTAALLVSAGAVVCAQTPATKAPTSDKPTMSETANAQPPTPGAKGSKAKASSGTKEPMAEATNEQTAPTPAAKASSAKRRHKAHHGTMANATEPAASAAK